LVWLVILLLASGLLLFPRSPSPAARPRGVLSFCFRGRAAPSELLSFPTRRSSDLIGARGRSLQFPQVDRVGGAGLQLPHDVADQDRKSTRLNSSHLGISYAVFCLKKKKRIQRRTTHKMPSN